MRLSFIWCVSLLLTAGCVDTSALQSGFAQRSAVTANNALDAAVWTMCKATPAGAVMRRFGQSKEQWEAFITVCWQEPVAAKETPPLN